jgi:hypothetical protein
MKAAVSPFGTKRRRASWAFCPEFEGKPTCYTRQRMWSFGMSEWMAGTGGLLPSPRRLEWRLRAVDEREIVGRKSGKIPGKNGKDGHSLGRRRRS